MNAGRLNRRIAIQQRLGTENELGERVSGWRNVATVWASIIQKSGIETVRSEMELSVVSASIRIRYRNDVSAGMRVLDGSTVYDIQAVLLDNVTKKYVDLVCQTGASNG